MPCFRPVPWTSITSKGDSRRDGALVSFQLTFTVAGSRVDAINELLEAAGACAIRIEEAEGPALYDEGLAEEPRYWPKTRIAAFFLSAQATDFAIHILADEPVDLHRATVADEGWEAQARSGWAPFAILDDLWIYPNDSTPPPERLAIHLDPGLAFGTGTHPTTKLCLCWIYASLKNPTYKGAGVLDFGCGSGILAIAALRLNAVYALAIDIDPLALEASACNAARNGVSARLTTGTPPLQAHEQHLLVVANILAGPLIRHSRMLAGAVASGGLLALSGILEEQVPQVRAAFPEFAFTLVCEGPWCLLHGARV